MIRIRFIETTELMINDGEKVHERTVRQLRMLLKRHPFKFVQGEKPDVTLRGDVVWTHDALGTVFFDFLGRRTPATYGPGNQHFAYVLAEPGDDVPHGILNTWSAIATPDNIDSLRDMAMLDENQRPTAEQQSDVERRYWEKQNGRIV